MTNVFDDFDPQTEDEITATIESFKTKFAKEDGSYDIDQLLKKAAHADRHIKTLEREAAERGSTDTVAAKLEEVLAKIEAKNNANGEQHRGSETSTETPRNDVDIEKLLNDRLSAYDAKNARERNRQFVRDEMAKAWGDNATTKMRARARELGEDINFLEQLAAERPQVFLNLMIGTQQAGVTDYQAPQSSHRITSSSSSKKTYADFEKMRKENPSLYKSKAVQDELFRLTAEYAAQGKSFTET